MPKDKNRVMFLKPNRGYCIYDILLPCRLDSNCQLPNVSESHFADVLKFFIPSNCLFSAKLKHVNTNFKLFEDGKYPGTLHPFRGV